ncbi:ABC transporter permease [Rhodovastum atsumiense]|uniref:ABC transporter permease n=1 Tax=Rhodovastum atsumiense TaxID=504468 RepID=A0A5M6J0V9_9PROT|nr:ABC transporter permease [Rhodovastum atsumiense]KAA5613707.1 ABC transporter permease [Rhodovastum atsumiense]CAH2599630.1 ABC transporter permease [Rhodovastum atsumiense]
MPRMVLLRIGATGVVLLGAALLLFALTLAIPGNPAQVLLGPRATPEAVAAFSAAMGLDRPLPVRLGTFLLHLLRGDLGTDVISGRSVLAMVLDVLPYTLTLTAAAMGLALLLGVPLGCLAATRPGSLPDRVLAVASVSCIAIPNFVVAVLLLLVFSTWLGWLPVTGQGDDPLALVLPAVALALGWVGYIARLLRSSLLEVLAAGHVRTLRAYGVPGRRVVGRYALRLAAIPVVAVLGLGIGRLLGGAILVEIVFARPGLGTLVFDAIGSRNYPVVQGSVFVAVTLFALANLVVDLLLLRLDPRIAA